MSVSRLRPAWRRLVLVSLVLMPSPVPVFSGGGQSDSTPAGAESYLTYCSVCHQPGGEGVTGIFPPLAGRIPSLVSTPGGRRYLPAVVLYGLEGSMTVGEETYTGVMPGFKQLSDGEIAALLNFLLALRPETADQGVAVETFTSQEIASARQPGRAPREVLALRPRRTAAAASSPPPHSESALPDADRWRGASIDDGKREYLRHCASCHGLNLRGGEFGGVPLAGNYFAKRWGRERPDALLAYTRDRMPPGLEGRLGSRTYRDIVAYILAENGVDPADAAPGSGEAPGSPWQGSGPE